MRTEFEKHRWRLPTSQSELLNERQVSATKDSDEHKKKHSSPSNVLQKQGRGV